jgi:ankyrin repeat protein
MISDINTTDVMGKTALHYACQNGNLKMAKILIEGGADVNAGDFNTPIFLCALYGYSEIFKFLIENGADIHAKNSYGVDVEYVLKNMWKTNYSSKLLEEVNKMVEILEGLK